MTAFTKRIIPILCLTLLFAGCASTPGDTATDATAAPTEAVTLVPTEEPTPTPTPEPINATIDADSGITLVEPAEGASIVLTNNKITEWLSKPYTLGCGYAYYKGANIYRPQSVTLQWDSANATSSYTVRVATKASFSNVQEFHATTNSYKLKNLFVGTRYYWQVIAHFDDRDAHSPVFSFATAQTPRFLEIAGVNNTRDVGGYVTEDGKYRVKQNMVLRSANLDSLSKKQVTAFLNEFAVKTDLDLRKVGADESKFLGIASPLGSSVQYINLPGVAYSNSFGSVDFMRELRVFLNEENYPIVVHCAGGKDRTGTLCFILGAILGVSEENLCFDYEATYFSVNAEKDGSILPSFDSFHKKFMALEGNTMAEKAAAFCHNIGITDKDIETIRSILLEPIEP